MAMEIGDTIEREPLPPINEARRFVRILLNRRLVVFGVIVVSALIISAIFAPLIAPYDPYQQDLRDVLSPPTAQHLLGTDSVGRDTLSRIIYGARIALLVGIVAVCIATAVGTALGLFAGYLGGWTYTIIMRLTDALMAIPPIFFALVMSVLLGTGPTNVMIAIAVALLPGYIRLMCGQVLSVKENDYVLGARSIGAGRVYCMFRYVLPNCLSPLIVQTTMLMGVAILIEATLSFLGAGITPPMAAWGAMVYEGYRYLITSPILALAPGVVIMMVVFAFNMVGDGLRDALDPRLRGVL